MCKKKIDFCKKKFTFVVMPAKIKVIGVRVTPEQQTKLKGHSEDTGVSQSTLIRVAIRRLLAELEKANSDRVIFDL
jgi:hypothetical protein